MNDIESRLAETMKARARNVEPDDETAALARITSRVDGRRNRALMVLGVAAAIALVIGAVALFRKGEDKQRVGVTATTTTVPVSTTSTTTTPKIVPSLPGPVAIWPFASSDRTFASPEEAAKSFAVEYLGMTNAVVGSSAGHTGEVTGVEIFPNNRGNARTV